LVSARPLSLAQWLSAQLQLDFWGRGYAGAGWNEVA
jgi:hypothetical protein